MLNKSVFHTPHKVVQGFWIFLHCLKVIFFCVTLKFFLNIFECAKEAKFIAEEFYVTYFYPFVLQAFDTKDFFSV